MAGEGGVGNVGSTGRRVAGSAGLRPWLEGRSPLWGLERLGSHLLGLLAWLLLGLLGLGAGFVLVGLVLIRADGVHNEGRLLLLVALLLVLLLEEGLLLRLLPLPGQVILPLLLFQSLLLLAPPLLDPLQTQPLCLDCCRLGPESLLPLPLKLLLPLLLDQSFLFFKPPLLLFLGSLLELKLLLFFLDKPALLCKSELFGLPSQLLLRAFLLGILGSWIPLGRLTHLTLIGDEWLRSWLRVLVVMRMLMVVWLWVGTGGIVSMLTVMKSTIVMGMSVGV